MVKRTFDLGIQLSFIMSHQSTPKMPALPFPALHHCAIAMPCNVVVRRIQRTLLEWTCLICDLHAVPYLLTTSATWLASFSASDFEYASA
jgi:hypothetical protein